MIDPLSGIQIREHRLTVPLDHRVPGGESLSLYAREIRADLAASASYPCLVYLQGGPGYGAPRPAALSGWLGEAITRYRVILLDQRGTGLSSPVDASTLARLPNAQAQADYLAHFRADAIVRDAELLRAELSPGRPWTVLGQSFGGFCTLTYLSHCPEGLAAAMITGGTPPIGVAPDEVYRATYQRVLDRNKRYHARYPQDDARLQAIAEHLDRHAVVLPSGSRLTTNMLRLLGLALGFSDGPDSIHYLLEEAFIEGPAGPELSYAFLRGVDAALPFDLAPFFSLLHEAIYCEQAASNWAAERVRGEYPQFHSDAPGPFQFTGEMVYPWMFDTFARLQPLKAAAELIAARSDWPALYDEAQLQRNTVPTVAAIFADDMYVERRFSEAVAERIPNFSTWVTPDWEHNALRVDGEALVFRRLQAMLEGAP
jgi:pimeloyl-ACP methyl ester carboxylesterase